MDYLKHATTAKDQLVTSKIASTININASPVTSTTTSAPTNDSKYLHKKFKKLFCATLDSNQTNSHSDTTTNKSTSASSTVTTSVQQQQQQHGALFNNNSEIVENKNWTPTSSIELKSANNNQQATSLRNYQFQSTVPSSSSTTTASFLSPPQHFQTTEEEKQLVKDIIDINNENNFIHQTGDHQLSSTNFLIASSSASVSNQFVTVTTLGNHNSNFQSADHRPKVAGNHSEQLQLNAYSQQPNGNFVIINNQQQPQPVDLNNQSAGSVSSVPITSASQTPGRYICPYCQLNCAKPSVLQKHIRAHTNERPFPCTLCGFAFKTKSNLYKHCR